MAGNITDLWSLSGGYTHLDIEDEDGGDTRIWLATRTLELSTTYKITDRNDLKLGGQLRWQNAISTQADGGTIRQKGYAVLDLMTSVKLADHVSASVHIRNVTNARCLNSLMWGQAYDAAPRSALATRSPDF